MIFYIAIITYIAIVDDLAPQVDLISSNKMTPLTPIQHPYIRDLMISIKVFGKLLVEPKKLLDGKTLRKVSKMVSKNLGVVSTPLNCFLNDFWDKWKLGYGRKRVGGFRKWHWCFFVVARSN
jgi:hypothetical protein